MPNPVPAFSDLQAFSGSAIAAGFTDVAYAGNALQMAADILELVIGDVSPADALERRLLSNATCEMAQALILEQPYKAVIATPFSHEAIGNYQYQKSTNTTPTVGIPKGLLSGGSASMSWFDMAIRHFGITEVAESTSTRVFEDDMVWLQLGGGDAGSDRRLLLGPIDMDPTMYGPVFRNNEFDSSGFAANRRGAD